MKRKDVTPGDSLPATGNAQELTSSSGSAAPKERKSGTVTVDAAKKTVSSSVSNPVACNPGAAKASLLRSLYSECIGVLVGPQKMDFTVHKGLICYSSKFFGAALNGSFSEAVLGTVELPEGKPATFERVYAWLYTKDFKSIKGLADVNCDKSHLVDLYVFGDKFNVPTLYNEAIDRIVLNYERYKKMFIKAVPRVYRTTLADSPLRKVIVATYLQYPSTLEIFYDKWKETFLACPELDFNLIKAYCTQQGSLLKSRRVPDPCQYHQHAEHEERRSTKKAS
ncbi:hypothetical protein N7G274_004723 [Stereocaulon virgatum]|uniref:BTB domain-containing protein n=1 Tax=Stereocaulon virgatum TaxID=373712 RepID=A0ABR4A9V7_9LECA